MSYGTAAYTYDAENRLIATAGTSYIYDGDGKRVEKCTQGATPGMCATNATGMLYWTGSGSDPLVETDLAGNVVSTYIFFGERRVARRDVSGTSFNVYYYFSDHLGTHSLITDANGTMPPKVESDYYPYGGEIQVFSSDTNHYKFTGKERDSESGLDNFGARFDTSNLGRFMSPDPKMVSGLRLVDPQQWNGYAYARNSTTVFVDPDGRELKLAIYYQGISESVAARVGRLASDKFSKAGVKNVSYELHAGHPSSLTILSYGVPGAIGFSNSSVLELRQGPDATGNLLGSSIPPFNAGQNWHGYSAVDVNWVSSKTSNDAQLAQGLANEVLTRLHMMKLLAIRISQTATN